jgi:hypothetical protein
MSADGEIEETMEGQDPMGTESDNERSSTYGKVTLGDTFPGEGDSGG